MADKTGELTTREAANLAKIDTSYVRHLLLDGILQGRKVEVVPGFEVWKVSKASLEAWMSRRKKR